MKYAIVTVLVNVAAKTFALHLLAPERPLSTLLLVGFLLNATFKWKP